ncbi:Zinc finger protein ZAT4 [Ananas comosus]|uniref:Zinc finger protein ZAT4 n=1 Tax=Ananas comosus TaxID=4615 RepID=A0A199VYM6_ANACO|nr:Zinc finger protein ZAT4 [Ananas comosus]
MAEAELPPTTTSSSSSRTFMELRACLRLPEPAVPRRAATRRRSRRVASIAAASEVDEEEDVALCLMMLSRDSLSKRSFALERKGEEEFPAKPKKSTGGESEKRARFACPECNRPFRSYQALGGHRANRKRINGAGCCSSSSKIPSLPDDSFGAAVASPESAKKARAHRCPICDKVFGSGQALGGHKRSHLMASSSDRRVRICSVDDESRDLLDLNLPAPVVDDDDDDDDDDEDSSNVNENVEYKSWWVEGEHKHGSLVGFI